MRTEYAEILTTLSREMEHCINEVLYYLRAGELAGFCYVRNYKDREFKAFSYTHKFISADAYLRY